MGIDFDVTFFLNKEVETSSLRGVTIDELKDALEPVRYTVRYITTHGDGLVPVIEFVESIGFKDNYTAARLDDTDDLIISVLQDESPMLFTADPYCAIYAAQNMIQVLFLESDSYNMKHLDESLEGHLDADVIRSNIHIVTTDFLENDFTEMYKRLVFEARQRTLV